MTDGLCPHVVLLIVRAHVIDDLSECVFSLRRVVALHELHAIGSCSGATGDSAGGGHASNSRIRNS